MSKSFESIIHCNHPHAILENIMQEAVNQYLSSHKGVTLAEKNNQSVVLRIPINFRSLGEELKVLVQEEYFSVMSKCWSPIQIVAWGRNRDNVRDMCICLENAMDGNE